MNKVKKVIKNVVADVVIILCVALTLWFIVSFIEVDMKNLTENPVYSSWNFFEIFLKFLTKT